MKLLITQSQLTYCQFLGKNKVSLYFIWPKMVYIFLCNWDSCKTNALTHKTRVEKKPESAIHVKNWVREKEDKGTQLDILWTLLTVHLISFMDWPCGLSRSFLWGIHSHSEAVLCPTWGGGYHLPGIFLLSVANCNSEIRMEKQLVNVLGKQGNKTAKCSSGGFKNHHKQHHPVSHQTHQDFTSRFQLHV